jgi:transposase
MFSYVSAEQRVPKDHPLRAIRAVVDDVLREMSREFDGLYATVGRLSIPPERLLRVQLLQIFYSIRSERLLMEQLDYNLLFRWFVGMEMDEPISNLRRCSRRTATGCSTKTSPGASSAVSWIARPG